MNDQTTHATLADEDDELDDDSIGASIEIDYAQIMATTEPDQPGGRAAFDSDDYETDEEADAAFEAFFAKLIEGPHEES